MKRRMIAEYYNLLLGLFNLNIISFDKMTQDYAEFKQSLAGVDDDYWPENSDKWVLVGGNNDSKTTKRGS